MKSWTYRLFILAVPLALCGCLWGPGKFTSDLALRKNGTFTLDYRGEIMLQLPEDKTASPPWDPKSMVRCNKSGEVEIFPDISGGTGNEDGDPQRPCNPAEIAKAKTQYEKQVGGRAEAKRDESEKIAKLFGLPGVDDESNRAFAARLMKFQGWKTVTYKGKGVFDVVYHFEGRTTQDYVFPLMPDSDLMIPFLTIRRRNDGSVTVAAPAFTGGQGPFGARAKMMGLPSKGEGPPSRAEGRFTITTDGEILTKNSEDGPVAVPSGKSVRWDVNPGTTKIPEMLVRL